MQGCKSDSRGSQAVFCVYLGFPLKFNAFGPSVMQGCIYRAGSGCQASAWMRALFAASPCCRVTIILHFACAGKSASARGDSCRHAIGFSALRRVTFSLPYDRAKSNRMPVASCMPTAATWN